ncbi:MAG: helicase-related protein [Gammaproteobacteria bacterium]
MKRSPVILDNRRAGLAEYLRGHLDGAEMFRIVSAYFSVFGFETLADGLESAPLKKVKFLFGDPESAGEVVSGEKTRRTFHLTETGLSVDDGVLRQRRLAERCAEWMGQKSVEVRKISRRNFLHGKMYHLESAAGGAATVGSSNFTRRGMGESQNPNVEINLAAEDADTLAALAEWFDELWDAPELTEDAKPEVLAALARWREEYAPEFVYYKTLFELFREEIETYERNDAETGATGLHDTEIWKALYEFQKDGAQTVIGRLLRHGGCILADSVGLGKTYTALAAIKYFELRNKSVLVLCPKKLEQNWRAYQAAAFNSGNPFAADKFGYALLAHTDLGRESGMVGGVDLRRFNWGAYDLVVIDESHNFRNDSQSRRDPETDEIVRRSRYETLMEDVIKSGADTRVLMLSATPVNTSLIDLRNQIYLMTGKNDGVFAESLDVRSVKDVVRAAQKKFHEWEKRPHDRRKKGELLAALGGDFLNLLGGVTIARSRRQIKKFYGKFIAEQGDFPVREKPQNECPHTDSLRELSYKDLHADLSRLQFHIYRPSDYADDDVRKRLVDEKKARNFNQQDREKFLVAMMRVNFWKRLESSAHACKLTLERTLGKIDGQTDQIEKFLQQRENVRAEILGDEEREGEEQEDENFFVNRKARTPYRLRELDVNKWRADMEKDRLALQDALDKVRKITPQRDGKLALLKEQIRRQAARPNRKMLVFTTFKDTAEYLYKQLRELAGELNIKIAFVAGGNVARIFSPRRQLNKTAFFDGNAEHGMDEAGDFTDILDRFSPRARGRDVAPDKRIDLLVATDCISEGQNLQDCDTVLNYDIHWNPVRLMQRFGRIDRLGSKNKSVRMINYWPPDDMDSYLDLQDRVHARMALMDAAAGGDDDTLNISGGDGMSADEVKEAVQTELHFRDEQFRRMRDEIVDLEDMDDSVNMSDLTLDYFIAQLLRYLQANREALEAAPPGVYAVADAADGDALQNGAIFFFRGIVADETAAQTAGDKCYFVHAEKGRVRRGYLQIRDVLRVFESLALGKTEPLKKLCDSFSRETETEEGMRFYDEMARAAVADIVDTFNAKAGESLRADAGRGGVLPPKSERPAAGNLRLLTWLVIKKDEPARKPVLTPPRERDAPPPMFDSRRKKK